MGILPLEYRRGETARSLGLSGEEIYHIEGLGDRIEPRSTLEVRARNTDGSATRTHV